VKREPAEVHLQWEKEREKKNMRARYFVLSFCSHRLKLHRSSERASSPIAMIREKKKKKGE